MLYIFLLCMTCWSTPNTCSFTDYDFQLIKQEDSYFIKSCHPTNIYQSNLWIPDKINEDGNAVSGNRIRLYPGQTKSHSQAKKPEHIILLKGTRWKNECLLFPLENNDLKAAIELLAEITKLDKKQITITY